MNNNWNFNAVIAVAVVLFLVPEPAAAYIDPGIGSLLFQSVVAVFAAVSVFWGVFKAKLSVFYNKARKKEERTDSGLMSEKSE